MTCVKYDTMTPGFLMTEGRLFFCKGRKKHWMTLGWIMGEVKGTHVNEFNMTSRRFRSFKLMRK